MLIMKYLPILALAFSVLVGCSTDQPASNIPNNIVNFAVVNAKKAIYRGGQPDTNGFAYLKSIGVSNIVKLNLEPEGPGWKDSDWAMAQGGVMTEGVAQARVTDFTGFTVSYLPITLEQQLLGPVPWVAHAARQMQAMPGTFVHCEHGQDRTGLVVACYRVKAMGWTKADAEKEMLEHGFHKELHGLHEYWENFPNQDIWKKW